jgi:hypothetical protein
MRWLEVRRFAARHPCGGLQAFAGIPRRLTGEFIEPLLKLTAMLEKL